MAYETPRVNLLEPRQVTDSVETPQVNYIESSAHLPDVSLFDLETLEKGFNARIGASALSGVKLNLIEE